MPAAPPLAFATIAQSQPSKPYILRITPTSLSGHLILTHPSPELSVADNQTLKAVDVLRGVHSAPITSVRCEEGSIWSASKDATIVRWDERSRNVATKIEAFVRKPLPVTALEVSESDHLVIGGTELVSSEAHILFWDTRNPKEPAYKHSSTHSDDITHLSLLPATTTWQKSGGERRLPGTLLLSASTDGCVVLSDMRETDEEEAVQAEENWNQSIAAAGSYLHKGVMRVWARSDMDNMAQWGVGVGPEDEFEFRDYLEVSSDQFKFRDFTTPQAGPSVVAPPMAEKAYPPKLRSDYLIDACPTLGVGKAGGPMVGIGTNDGNIVLQHTTKAGIYEPSAYFVSGPGERGHKDVVRCMFHAIRDEALYTGSEDGVLAGWSLASLPKLVVGDPDIDNDDGDGREAIDSEDEESEIETESSSEESDRSDNDMDMDMDLDEPRGSAPVLGGGRRLGQRKEVRKVKRHAPY